MKRGAAYLLVLLFCCCSLIGCSSTPVQKHSINAAFDVKVTDPDVRRLTDVTSKIDILATGEFAPGTYVFNNKEIAIAPDTQFRLNLTLPIDDPAVVHSRDATGTLWTSRQLTVNKMPVPQVVDLRQGQVSVEVDLIRSLGALFVSYLQKGGEVSDVRQIIERLHLEQAKLNLREDSFLHLGRHHIHIGPDSEITLKDVIVGSDLTYNGDCHVHMNFLDHCKWVGDRTRCFYDGGTADLDLVADKTNERVHLTLKKQKRRSALINLSNVVFQFGRDFRSSASSTTCAVTPSDIQWQFLGNGHAPQFHMDADLDLKKTTLLVKSDVQETTVSLPEALPARLTADQSPAGVTAEFGTTESADAPTVKVAIKKRSTGLTIWLTDAELGPCSLDRSGAFNFSLENATAHLQRLDWQGKGRSFSLVTAGGASVSIPDGLLLERTSRAAPTTMRMPLDVKLGTATISGASGTTTLTDLNGKLLVDVDREIQISGDMDFQIPKSHLLAGQPVDITAHGLDLSMADGRADFQLKKCTVSVPQGAIQQAINDKLPDDLSFDVDRTVWREEKWRYRQAVVKHVNIHNLRLTRMQPHPPDAVTFTAVADIELIGSIEQQQKRRNGEESGCWEVRPWRLTGHLDGDGVVSYKFKARDGANENQIAYTLSMELPVPSDVQLDWSQVAQGFLGFVERKVIVSHLRKITIPVNYQGHLAIFPADNPLTKNFRVRNLMAKHTDDSTELQFAAGAKY